MRHIFIIILFFSSFCFGQKIVVSNATHNLLYLGISNPVDICVEGLKCTQLTVKVDNGEIKKENCNYIIRPERTGTIKISIFKKSKLIAEKFMNVVESELIAEISMPKNNTGNLLIERATRINIDVKQQHIDFNYSSSTIEYDFIIIRGDKVIFRNSFNDYVFNNELKNELKKVVENDLIIFTNMNIKFESGENYYINDIIIKKD